MFLNKNFEPVTPGHLTDNLAYPLTAKRRPQPSIHILRKSKKKWQFFPLIFFGDRVKIFPIKVRKCARWCCSQACKKAWACLHELSDGGNACIRGHYHPIYLSCVVTQRERIFGWFQLVRMCAYGGVYLRHLIKGSSKWGSNGMGTFSSSLKAFVF